jgi:hypothetical protein
MADHSLGAALYALKALKSAEKPIDAERRWQNNRLPAAVKKLVISAREKKSKR